MFKAVLSSLDILQALSSPVCRSWMTNDQQKNHFLIAAVRFVAMQPHVMSIASLGFIVNRSDVGETSMG